MEIIKIKELETEMEKLCDWKLRTLLHFNDVSQVTQMVLSFEKDEDMRNYIQNYCDQADANGVQAFIRELLILRKKHRDLQAESGRNKKMRVVDANVGEDVQVYRKQNYRDIAPGLQKKKQGKQNKKMEKQIRQILNNEANFVRKLCDCQASEHRLIGNCLQCGKIICTVEGEGPCLFCGSLKNDDTVDNSAATAHRDRLLKFERVGAGTKILDDQTDHFDYESNSWLSEKEKEAQRKKREAEDAAMEEDKRKIKITLDLAGRRIVEQTDEVEESSEDENENHSLDYMNFARITSNSVAEKIKGNEHRAFFNPFLRTEGPVFRKSNKKATQKAKVDKTRVQAAEND